MNSDKWYMLDPDLGIPQLYAEQFLLPLQELRSRRHFVNKEELTSEHPSE